MKRFMNTISGSRIPVKFRAAALVRRRYTLLKVFASFPDA
jgi:hypothetical protein